MGLKPRSAAEKLTVMDAFLSAYGVLDERKEVKEAAAAVSLLRRGALPAWAGSTPAAAAAAEARVKGMACIAGTGPRGFVPGDDKATQVVSDVCIDVTEVTVAAYGRCVAKGKCTRPNVDSIYCNWGKASRGEHPVNCVDLMQAQAYCAAEGKRLPTEWEWEWAARGRDEGRTYPWGEEAPSCARAVMDEGGPGCGKDRTWPVGSKPGDNSRDGLKDMAGNVAEWT